MPIAHIHSYPKIYNFGHPAIADLLLDDVVVEEKVDGSQFSFCLTEDNGVQCRSHRKEVSINEPMNMFEDAVNAVMRIWQMLKVGWVYRAEYLRKPKHNTICYSRIPNDTLIIYDIETSPNTFLGLKDKKDEAEMLGFECVPSFFFGRVKGADEIKTFLDNESILGGSKVEGIVVKNYQRFGRDGKVMMGKHVSEAFKEKNKAIWKNKNPGGKSFVQNLIEIYRTEARWQKAVQHLEEDGALENSPVDIGPIMREIHKDLADECAEEIKEKLFEWAMKQIKRGVCSGAAEWYKGKLIGRQFDDSATSDTG